MTEVILHHYPMSPYAEKARTALGIKRLAWRSVTIPVVMPKPDLLPLTGGYRKTPVMQIGADIYCDTQCILRELERRFPEPSFYHGTDAGTANALSFYLDRTLFSPIVGMTFGISQRRSCGLIGISEASCRYVSVRTDTGPLLDRLRELAQERTRYGYRRLHVLLRREGF